MRRRRHQQQEETEEARLSLRTQPLKEGSKSMKKIAVSPPAVLRKGRAFILRARAYLDEEEKEGWLIASADHMLLEVRALEVAGTHRRKHQHRHRASHY